MANAAWIVQVTYRHHVRHGAINMKPNMKVEQEVLPPKEQQIQEVQQIWEISKEDLNEVSGGCGDMGGVVVIRF
jgi:hypothetical protein